jgi:hypothetical protein
MRVDTITDIEYVDGKVIVAGLSNEEFASTIWQMEFPFSDKSTYTTLEIFHGAHGEYETHAPIRTFVPYRIEGEAKLLASYLCTPLVTFSLSDLSNGEHVKGTTVAEFGSGNYPLDMVVFEYNDKEMIVLSNSSLPLLTFDPTDISKQKSITEEVPAYTAGVPYVARAYSGVMQIDALNSEWVLALRRMPSGKLDLVSLSTRRLAI